MTFPDIEGWMSDEERQWLYEQACHMGSVAEVGCWKGRSTWALLAGCAGPVYAVDHWRGSANERAGAHAEAVTGDVFRQFKANVGHFPNLRIVRSDSQHAAMLVPDVDMVFIDAGHSCQEVMDDCTAWGLKANKLLCGHDRDWPGVRLALGLMHVRWKPGPGSIWVAA